MRKHQPDEATGQLLGMLQGAGAPPLPQQTVEQAREGMRQVLANCGPARVEVGSVQDFVAPADGAAGIPCRVYVPETTGGSLLPLLLHFHGGGFMTCDLDTHDNVSRYYCRNVGAIVVSVDYRLAPEHPFPAGVEDCYSALLWAADHGASWGADPRRIAVVGDSAGGTLAAAVCHMVRERGGPRVSAQVLFTPPLDLDPLDAEARFPSRAEFGGGEFGLSAADATWLTQHYMGDRMDLVSDPRASPLRASRFVGLPETLIVTAGLDYLRDEGLRYAEALRGAGVPVTYRCVEGTIHGLVQFAGVLPSAAAALAQACEFLSHQLSGAGS